MPLFNETYCQLCERFLSKKQRNKRLSSSRHLHKEVNGYRSASFPQRKVTRDEGSILRKLFGR